MDSTLSRVLSRTFYSAILLLIAAGDGRAENNHDSLNMSLKKSFAFTVGTNRNRIEKLNDQLDANGLAKLPENFFSFGLNEKRRIINNVFIGLEGNVLLGRSNSTESYKSSFLGSNGIANLGYLFKFKDIVFYPHGGIGVGFYKLTISERAAYTLQEALADPSRELNIQNSCLLLNAGFGMDFPLTVKQSSRGGKGLIIGLQTGYSFAPWVSAWKMNGQDLPGDADTGISGFYFRMTIGNGIYR